MIFRFLFFILLLLLPSVAGAESFLVENGQARAEIVIAEKPSRSTRLAAQELQRYIEKITGAKLLITNNTNGESVTKFFVGRSSHTDKVGVTADGLTDGAYRVVAG
jgi:hypothetical protein